MAINKSSKNNAAPKRFSFDVDEAATIYAGMAVMLGTNAAGDTVVQACDATSTPLGIAWGDKTMTTQELITYEVVTFSAGAGLIQNLNHANLVASSYRVENTAHTTMYTEGGGADYTMAVANGVITNTLAGAITATQTVHVTYRYNVPANQLNFFGQSYDRVPDDTIGSGKITVVQGIATIYTDQYDPTRGGAVSAYALDDPLYSTATGLLTNNAGGGGPIIGKVIEIPTATQNMLGCEINVPSA